MRIILFFALINSIFFGRDLLNIAVGDDFFHFLPDYYLILDSLKSFHLPFWTPYSNLGIPELFMSDWGIFYPGVWIVLLFNLIFNTSLDINLIGKSFQFSQYTHIFLGSLSMYFLLKKKFHLTWISSFIGGVIYGFSPFSLWDLTVISALPGKMYFPLIIYLLLNFLEKANFKNFFLLTTAHYLLFSFGYPYHSFFIILSELGLAVFYGLKPFLRLSSLVAISVLLSSIFLLPNLYIYSQASTRFFKPYTTPESGMGGATAPTRLINILNPLVFNKQYDTDDPSQIYTSGNLTWGVIPLIFLIVGLANFKKNRINIWLMTLFVFGFVYSLVGYLDIPGFLGIVPIFERIRSQLRVLILPFFAGCVFLAMGVNNALEGLRNRKLEVFLWSVFTLLFLFLLSLPVFCKSCLSESKEAIISLGRVLLLLGIGLLFYHLTQSQKIKIFLILGLILTIFEFNFYYKMRENSRLDISYKDRLQQNSLISEIPTKDNLFRNYFYNNQFAYDTHHLKVFNFLGLESIPAETTYSLMDRFGFEKSMRFSNVKYVTSTEADLDKKYSRFRMIKSLDPSKYPEETFVSSVPKLPYFSSKSQNIHYIYEIEDYLPRFFVPSSVNSCKSKDCYSQENPPETVFTKENISHKNPPKEAVTLKILSYSPNKVELNVDTTEETFVSSSERWDRGWSLRINNKSARIHDVSNGFRGFIVPKGFSQVAMSYFPPYFFEGLLLTSFGVIIIFVIYKRGFVFPKKV